MKKPTKKPTHRSKLQEEVRALRIVRDAAVKLSAAMGEFGQAESANDVSEAAFNLYHILKGAT